MKAITKRRLKVYLPIVIAFVLCCVIIAIIFLSNKITAKDYFNALSNSNYTKQVQTTTINDGELLVYEKIEIILKDGENIYHKIEEKQISSDLNKDYDVTTTEIYYTKDKMYYFEDNVWKYEDFEIANKLKKYYLKSEYFESLSFNKKIDTQGKLTGKVKNASINDVVAGASFKDMNLTILVNKNFNIQSFNIIAKTSTNRDVTIKSTYSYNKEIINIPV